MDLSIPCIILESFRCCADDVDTDDDVAAADVAADAVITIGPSFKLESTIARCTGRLRVHLRFTTPACA